MLRGDGWGVEDMIRTRTILMTKPEKKKP